MCMSTTMSMAPAATTITEHERTERSPGRHAGGAVGPEERSERRSENNDRVMGQSIRYSGHSVKADAVTR